jgi:hypothetical protein
MDTRGGTATARVARWALLAALSAGAVGMGCGADSGASARARDPHEPMNPAGIGPAGDKGPPARDMPGRGRGSEGPHGR